MSRLVKLASSQMEDIRKFEEQGNNVILLAYERSSQPTRFSAEQLKKIQSLEKELGVILVAYKSPTSL